MLTGSIGIGCGRCDVCHGPLYFQNRSHRLPDADHERQTTDPLLLWLLRSFSNFRSHQRSCGRERLPLSIWLLLGVFRKPRNMRFAGT